jgi:hypothetical protein
MFKYVLSFFLVGSIMAAEDYKIVEGDIALKLSSDKASFLRSSNRWPGGVVPWTIDPNDAGNRPLIKAVKGALDLLNKNTNLVFKKATNEDKNYIVFTTKNEGCFSYVGLQGGAQEVNLSRGCHQELIVSHEILHAIGMEHEQSREDRDNYLKINWGNIKEDQVHNFDKVPRSNFGEYNLNSIMHYGSFSFTKNGQPTMITRDGKTFQQNLRYFTKGDQEAVNAFYPVKFNFNLDLVDLSFEQDGKETTFVQLKTEPQMIKSIASVIYKINGGEPSDEVTNWDNNFRVGFTTLVGRNVIHITFNLKDGTKEEAEFTYFYNERNVKVDCEFSTKRLFSDDETTFSVPITYDGDEPLVESHELRDFFAKAQASYNTETNTMELKLTVGRESGLIREEEKEERSFTISENGKFSVEIDKADLSCNVINEVL